MGKCATCGKPAGLYKLCEACIVAESDAERRQQAATRSEEGPSHEGFSESAVAHTQSGSLVVHRYRDAYRVGAALVGLGNGIKIVGGILGFGILIGFRQLFGETVLGGVFAAVFVAGLFWVCGVIVTAQGQILQATLDNAVASSHFLTEPERADAMGLPRSVADRSVLS